MVMYSIEWREYREEDNYKSNWMALLAPLFNESQGSKLRGIFLEKNVPYELFAMDHLRSTYCILSDFYHNYLIELCKCNRIGMFLYND